MDPDRLERVATAIASNDPMHSLRALCAVSIELLAVTGATIAITDGDQHLGALVVSDANIAKVDDLQFELGEGPSLDASRDGGPVCEANLPGARDRWPAFSAAAVDRGVAAAFAFPLQIGWIRHGVLALYRGSPGDLSPRDQSDAATLARIGTHLMLDLSDSAVPGGLPGRLGEVADHRAHVHQACGMISAQLGTDLGQALSRLRAHAWADGRSIDEVATDVVARRLRFGGAV